jgi:transcriptional regulator with XRE-family HTH domain
VARSPTAGDLGRTIRRLRQERQLSQESLAHAAQIHPTYVSGIERGRRNPSWSVLASLARALGLRLSELVSEIEREAS